MRRLSLMLVLLLSACAHRSWERASSQDTVEAYQAFLRDTPEGEFAESARARIEELEYEQAVKLHTVVAYKRYLEQHPDAAGAGAARQRLEALRFNAALERDTVLGWKYFLREHPEGTHREEAERRLSAAELTEASRGGEVKAISAALSGAQNESARLALAAKLDDARYGEARSKGAAALYSYLREVAAGAHRDEARVELLRRELDGLVVSGLEADALAKLDGHPLAAKLPTVRDQILAAQQESIALRKADVTLQNALAGFHLRSIDDLVRSLASPDPLDRWQAAEELGQHVSIRVIDPLLEAVRVQRNVRVRQQALLSLQRVLGALPPEVREFEVARRVEELQTRAAGAEVQLSIALLLDLSGNPKLAAAEYQRAFDPKYPEPLVLRRWAALRRERKELHSAAVAARQLALWARTALEDEAAPGTWTLAQARNVCAAVDAARFAAGVLAESRQAPTEFPEDLAMFEREVLEIQQLAIAKLGDVEIALRQRQPDVRTCADEAVSLRLAGAEQARVSALERLSTRTDPPARQALVRARERDPSPAVRQLAARLLSAL